MLAIKNIVKVSRTFDNEIDHYDVNYKDGFVIAIFPSELMNLDDVTEIHTKADVKATAMLSQNPSYTSQILA